MTDQAQREADQRRLAEIDFQIQAAGYWGARLTALNEERARIVERLTDETMQKMIAAERERLERLEK
jgi:hypothetical protein